MVDEKTVEQVVNDPKFKQQFMLLFATMRASAVVEISYEFSGGGDDGAMENTPEVKGLHEDAVSLEQINIVPVNVKEYAGTMYQGNGPEVQYREQECSNLLTLSRSLAQAVLDHTPYDWVNNDGGHGLVVFSFTPENTNKVFLDMNINYMTSEPHPSEFEFSNG